jgi:hypothetical protein
MRRATVLLVPLVVVAFTSTQPLPAQTHAHERARIVGRVFDQSYQLVSGVDVFVNRGEVRAVTDTSGIFHLQILPSDSTVGFRKIGYRPLVVRIDPLPRAEDTLLVQLESVPLQLAEITVIGRATKPLRYAGTTKYDEVFQRRKLGLGTLVTREDIDRRFGVQTFELLATIPGVHIWNGPPKRIRFARCQDPAGISVFIDGVLEMSSDSRSSAGFNEEPVVEALSRINPSDVEMIEVYRGASEIPAVFHWDGCAVIAIWTRWNSK